MNLIQEIYKKVLEKAGSHKDIRGLTATQKKAWRDGHVSPGLKSIKSVLAQNDMSATMSFENKSTDATLTIK